MDKERGDLVSEVEVCGLQKAPQMPHLHYDITGSANMI